MFDCGNSRRLVVKKERKHSSSVSVSSCDSNPRYRQPSSRRYNDTDLLYSLLEDLRYSGRVGYTDDRYRRYEKAYESRKSPKPKCIKEDPSLTFDGGTSLSTYTTGPVIDLGSSAANPEQPLVSQGGACINNAVYGGCSGADLDCDDKIVFDGGTA